MCQGKSSHIQAIVGVGVNGTKSKHKSWFSERRIQRQVEKGGKKEAGREGGREEVKEKGREGKREGDHG